MTRTFGRRAMPQHPHVAARPMHRPNRMIHAWPPSSCPHTDGHPKDTACSRRCTHLPSHATHPRPAMSDTTNEVRRSPTDSPKQSQRRPAGTLTLTSDSPTPEIQTASLGVAAWTTADPYAVASGAAYAKRLAAPVPHDAGGRAE